jgi:drug/metabolite transporter (DMT)-like permease
LNAAAYAIYLVIAGRFQVATGLAAGSISITGTLLVLLPIGLFTNIAPPTDIRAFLALVGLGTIATVLPIVFMFRGIRYIGSTNASILSTIEPVMTLILAGILLGEMLIWQQGIGGILILLSVILLNLPRRFTKKRLLSEEPVSVN